MQVALPPPTPARVGAVQVGMASWYGHPYHGRTTSNGETYDMNELTAAHLSLPFDTTVRVTNLVNGRSLDLRINDRGPFLKSRVIDVSRAAAERLGMIAQGTAKVRVEVVATPEMTKSATWRPASLASSPSSTACDGSRHGVQVGSFHDPRNADEALAGIASQYAGARIVVADSAAGTLYRVVVAAPDSTAARQMLQRLQSDGRDGFITRIPANSACLAANAS